jgi:hypothetical protein
MLVISGTKRITTTIAMIGPLIVDLNPKAPRSSDLMLLSLVIQRYNGVCQTCKECYVIKLLSHSDMLGRACGEKAIQFKVESLMFKVVRSWLERAGL